VPARQHPLVQNSAYKNPIFLCTVNNDVPFMFHTAISTPNLIARPASPRNSRELLKTALQTIEIAVGLFQAPCIQRVVGNLDEVEPSQPRKPNSRLPVF
jgi:hypothetical protein